MAVNIDISAFYDDETLDHPTQILRAALRYVEQGFAIKPAEKNGKGAARAHLHSTTDRAKVIEWFSGEFLGCNIMADIPKCPFTVIDMDRHEDGADGFAESGLLDTELEGLIVETPHDGRHIFITDRQVRVKVKGVEHKKNTILLPPSIVDGKQYRWVSGGEIGPLSEKMKRAFGAISGLPESPTARARREIVESAQAPQVAECAPPSYVNYLLEYVDPDCEYSEWLRVGMALHSNDDSEESLMIWDDWSQGGSKYKPGETAQKWDSFRDKSDPVTFRWLIFTAHENGCPPHPDDAKYLGSSFIADSVCLEYNKKYTIRQGANGIRVCFISDSFNGKNTLCAYTISAFRELTMAEKIHTGRAWVQKSEVWLNHPRRRRGDLGMYPLGQEPPNTLNLFTGFTNVPIECTPDDVKFFLDHTLNVICRGNKEYCDFLLDTLAYKIQHPVSMIGTAIILQGEEGTGKTSFFNIMNLIIGRTHSVSVSERSSLVGEYTGGILGRSVWITGNEAIWAGAAGEAERLKALVTEEEIDFADKFIPKWSQKNSLYFGITTNNEWAVPAGMESRRFFVLRVSDDYSHNEAYWREFRSLLGRNSETLEAINPEYISKVHYYLLNREITQPINKALVTPWLIAQRRETLQRKGNKMDGFVLWCSRVLYARPANDMIIGATDYNFTVVSSERGDYVVPDNMQDDYFMFCQKHRFISYNTREFNDRLDALGLTRQRVYKKEFGLLSKGEMEKNKTTLRRLIPPHEVKDALTKQYADSRFIDDTEVPDEED